VLTVRDNGTGMDENTVSRIFEPFFTTKPKGKGTGLGLATVYGIVQQSSGTISVESAEGEGSRFEICIPLADGAHEKASIPPTEDAKLVGQETILVVEDEIMLLDVVAKILRNYGYTVLTAPHGGDALLICEEHKEPIDLLLVDVVMPRLNGPELAERLCGKRSEMRVLFVSGYSDFTVVRHVVATNADHFLAKPFSARDLAIKVRQVLDRRSE
jgi:two-component system cell cycle sensor histidine kinase/response regulator CckA